MEANLDKQFISNNVGCAKSCKFNVTGIFKFNTNKTINLIKSMFDTNLHKYVRHYRQQAMHDVIK